MSTTDGGPAFPCPRYVNASGETHSLSDKHGEHGMSLRDWLAGQALQGWISILDVRDVSDDLDSQEMSEHKSFVAAASYRYADAMLKAREVKP